MVHVVRDADLRDVLDISTELRAVKADLDATGTGCMLRRFGPLAARVPGLFPAMYAVMSRSKRVHLATGRVQVTAVGMFAGGAGFAIAPPTLASLVHRPQRRRRSPRHPLRCRPAAPHGSRRSLRADAPAQRIVSPQHERLRPDVGSGKHRRPHDHPHTV